MHDSTVIVASEEDRGFTDTHWAFFGYNRQTHF